MNCKVRSALACCLIGSLAIAPVSGLEKSESIVIIVQQDPAVTPPGAPRTPVFNPFFAELMNGYVLLGSSSSYGTVHVTITSTAGDNYTTSFDTEDGTIVLPISGDSGFYSLRITTSGDLQFIGEFTI